MKKLITLLVTLFTMLTFALPAIAGEQAEELSLNQAMQKAFTYDTELQNTKLNLEKLDITLDSVRWSMNGIMSGYNIPDETDRATHRTFFETDTNYRLTEKSIDNKKRQLKIDVKEAYHGVLLAEQNLSYANKKLTLDLIKHSQTNAKFKNGMATQLDVLTSESQLEADKTAIKENTNAVTKAYNALNKLVGNNQDDRSKLTDTILYQPIEDLDVDTMVLRAVNNSYDVWAEEQNVKKLANTKYYETSYNIGEYSESQAQNTLKSTKESIKQKARTYCLDIIDKQNKYVQAETQEKQLEEAIKVNKVRYEVGLVTKDVLDELSLSLEQVKLNKDSYASGITITFEKLQRLTGELSTTI